MKDSVLVNFTEIQKTCWENLTEDKLILQSASEENTSAVEQGLLGTVITLTTIISILGNLLTCVIVYRKSAMRSAINLLLTNIAFTDLALATTVMPFVLCGLVKETTLHHVVVCMTFSILKDTFTGVVCYTMLAVSMDRYMIIVHRREGICPKVAKKIVVLAWICCAVTTLPQLLSMRENQRIYYDHTLCGQYLCTLQTWSIVYTNILVFVLFFIPVTVMLYFYAVVLRMVQKCSSKVQNHPGMNVCVSVTQYSCKLGLPTMAVPVRFTGDFNAKRRAFGTILLMFITFIVCWSPYMVNRVVIVTYQSKSFNVTLTNALLCIGFLKSTLYPIIYYSRNKKFRAACIQIVPPLEKLSMTVYTSKQRRINPQSLYEYSSSDTRI